MAGRIIDPDQFDRLADEVEGTGIAVDFLTRYFCMLPGRVRRIQDTVNALDDAGGMGAVLSLKVTSSMVGAVQLERLCGQLEPGPEKLAAVHILHCPKDREHEPAARKAICRVLDPHRALT